MALDKKIKGKVIKEFGISGTDTGSAQVQIALLTERIKQLTDHGEKNPKDFSTKRGLLHAVNARRKLLSYLQKHNKESYKKTIEKLGLRK